MLRPMRVIFGTDRLHGRRDVLFSCATPSSRARLPWVSSIDAQGNTNIAPFFVFQRLLADATRAGLQLRTAWRDRSNDAWALKDTWANIRETREFVINLVPESMADEMVPHQRPVAASASEFAHAGLTPVATRCSRRAWRACRLPYECVLRRKHRPWAQYLGDGRRGARVHIDARARLRGRSVASSIASDAVAGLIDMRPLRPAGRVFSARSVAAATRWRRGT